jgi:hypothetical protein
MKAPLAPILLALLVPVPAVAGSAQFSLTTKCLGPHHEVLESIQLGMTNFPWIVHDGLRTSYIRAGATGAAPETIFTGVALSLTSIPGTNQAWRFRGQATCSKLDHLEKAADGSDRPVVAGFADRAIDLELVPNQEAEALAVDGWRLLLTIRPMPPH